MSTAAVARPGPAPVPAPPGRELRDLNLAKIYVWEVPVRVTHWLIALSIAVLAATGIYIGHPFLLAPGPGRFVMGTVRAVHFYAAIVFTLAVVSRLAWMFLGNRYSHWDKFIPVAPRRYRGILPTLKFYLFMLRKPPGFVGHNPVAGLTYALVFLLYLAEIGTGFALYSASARVGSAMRLFAVVVPWVGGLQHARFLHHAVMWLLLGFTVHHVYSAVLMSEVEQNATMESIFSGYKFVPREDVVHSGYRFVDRAAEPPAHPEPPREAPPITTGGSHV